MEWIEIFKDILPELITIIAVVLSAVLSYFKVVHWDPKMVEGVINKITNAIFDTELEAKSLKYIGEQKLNVATQKAMEVMTHNELRVMKQIGKKANKTGNFFTNAVQNIFENSAKNLLEYGVKKGVDKIIGK